MLFTLVLLPTTVTFVSHNSGFNYFDQLGEISTDHRNIWDANILSAFLIAFSGHPPILPHPLDRNPDARIHKDCIYC